ncbi:MAG: hypothetical protein ACHP79_14845, partial [Terriglobales bacterium]
MNRASASHFGDSITLLSAPCGPVFLGSHPRVPPPRRTPQSRVGLFGPAVLLPVILKAPTQSGPSG